MYYRYKNKAEGVKVDDIPKADTPDDTNNKTNKPSGGGDDDIPGGGKSSKADVADDIDLGSDKPSKYT